MLKQVALVILLSIIALFSIKYLNHILHFIAAFHQLIIHSVGSIFAGDKVGYFIREVIALVLPPLFIAAIIELIMRLIKQDGTRYSSYGLWVSWVTILVLVGLR